MKWLQKIVWSAVMTVIMAGVVVGYTTPVAAQNPKEQVCNGVAMTGGEGGGCGGGDAEIGGIVQLAVNILSLIGGIAAVLVIIISGIRLITSAGAADAVATARNGIVYAIVGLIIIALSQIIVRFILGRIG